MDNPDTGNIEHKTQNEDKLRITTTQETKRMNKSNPSINTGVTLGVSEGKSVSYKTPQRLNV